MRDAVVLNAGAALAVYDGGVHDAVPAVASGMARAADAIDSGRAKDALSRWVAACAAVYARQDAPRFARDRASRLPSTPG